MPAATPVKSNRGWWSDPDPITPPPLPDRREPEPEEQPPAVDGPTTSRVDRTGVLLVLVWSVMTLFVMLLGWVLASFPDDVNVQVSLFLGVFGWAIVTAISVIDYVMWSEF